MLDLDDKTGGLNGFLRRLSVSCATLSVAIGAPMDATHASETDSPDAKPAAKEEARDAWKHRAYEEEGREEKQEKGEVVRPIVARVSGCQGWLLSRSYRERHDLLRWRQGVLLSPDRGWSAGEVVALTGRRGSRDALFVVKY